MKRTHEHFFLGSLTESHILLKSPVFNRRPYFCSTDPNIYILFRTSSVSNRITYCFVKLHFFNSLFSRRPCCFSTVSTVSRSLFFINIRVVCFQKNTFLLFYGFFITIFPFSDCLERILTIFRLIMLKLFEVICYASKMLHFLNSFKSVFT